MSELVAVGIGGFLGAVMRYVVSQWIKLNFGGKFPFVSLVVNVTGCFLAGAFLTLFSKKLDIPDITKTIIMVGFLGAFTTFSTFGVETISYFKSGKYLLAFNNIILNLLLSLGAIEFGARIVK
ncbi:MAG: fluoride efflux transporter CrcB [bacterium]|nr:fluoride efflux transporter CrcB [bacterium]